MTGDVRFARAAAVTLLVLLALPYVTNGAVIVRNNRQSVPKKISLHEARQLLQRQKRAASKPTPGSNQVLLNEVALNGTENHDHAYVHWSGKPTSDVMFILTVQYNFSGVADSELWRSDDYGSSFSKFSFGPGAQVSSFHVSPSDPEKMVFTDLDSKIMYTTTDELKTHHSVSVPVTPDEIYMHPEGKSDWMLLYNYRKKELYVTMNFGTTWSLLQDSVYFFDWAFSEFEHPGVVHIEIHPRDSEDAYYKRCTIPFCNSTGDGIDTQLGPFLTYSLQIVNEYIFVQRVLMNGQESHMLVSHKRQNFSNAYFPADVKTQDFLVLDASEGQVFLAVNHGNRMGASLYLSDPTGHYYVLSLTDVHHRSFGRWFDVDMHRVKGQNGTYLANQQTKTNPNHLKSLISFNKGGSWLEIPSPKGDKCKSDNCSFTLRLDMDSYFRDWILSEKRAPGFIIAHGHYGHVYEVGWDNLTVFTSRDGGWNWTESGLKGVYRFNILDQGSIVTAIKTGWRENSSQVFYSYDEGTHWYSDHFREEGLHVTGVLNEPSINTVVLSVYGHVSRTSPWIMIKLNFSKVLSKKCDDSKDYVTWRYSDHDKNAQENCLLGQEVKYKRKKSTSRCYNGEDFVRTVEKSSCTCTEEDFECDFGFSFSTKDNTCKQESWFNEGYIAPECTENEPHNMSRGYRKVGSDKCEGGVSSQDKYQENTSAMCPLVKPGHLLLTVNNTVVATGQPLFFHLLQKRGSVHTTTYSWNFTDSPVKNVTGLQAAQHQTHTFYRQGLHRVTVTATNDKGTSNSNTISIRAERAIRQVAVFNTWAVRVGVPVTVSASSNIWERSHSSLHYLYRFGDEEKESKEILTYASNVTHVYNKPGTYTISVTAVNSISAATKQASIKVIDDGCVAQLTFSSNVDRLFEGRLYYSGGVYFMLEFFRQELTMLLGVNLDRLALSLDSIGPVRLDCLILPKPSTAPAYEMTAEQIAQSFVEMVDNETLSLFETYPYFKRYGEINVTAITIMDYSGGDHGGGNKSSNSTGHGDHGGDGKGGKKKDNGINTRAIAIAVPVVALAGILTVVVVVCYRRRSRAQRYSLLSQEGSADPFLDEDDDLPLDMSDARDTGRSRDDPILDGNW